MPAGGAKNDVFSQSSNALCFATAHPHGFDLPIALARHRQVPPKRNWPAKSAYLKAENEVLRSKLPPRITITPKERQRLLKFGARLGKALHQIVTIVTPSTFLRWIREDKTDRPKENSCCQARSKTYY